ncbi:MerR family transcriptional regulator [Demetria terragena]|uniref:MerR family transcriptional regulator n=1 Tax=Demetria terragena TaxID=63959 RepID=UPI000684754C|nr:MerR family transcriptional regulator [Demetria terragena]
MTRSATVTGAALTVGEVAREVGVTVRTLHHYDQIGLVVPSGRSQAGYRLYTAADLERLQHVVVYRRLEMPLDDIRTMLESGDAAEHLRRQRSVVMSRLDELSELVAAIDDALEKTMDQQAMTYEDMKELFGGEFYDHQDEAEQRWGNTDAWKQGQRRVKSYGRAEWEQIKAETDQMQTAMAELFAAGVAADEVPAMDAVETHRAHIDRWWYDCSPAMHCCLGDLYVSDPRFTASYDEAMGAEGLAEWVRAAIYANAERQGVHDVGVEETAEQP